MPLCWIFLLKRRRALSNVSFSPTRTSANPGSPPQALGHVSRVRARGHRLRRTLDGDPVKGWRSIAEAPEEVKRRLDRESGAWSCTYATPGGLRRLDSPDPCHMPPRVAVTGPTT